MLGRSLETKWFLSKKWLRKDLRVLKMLDTPTSGLLLMLGRSLKTKWFLSKKWLRKDLRDLKMLDTPEQILYFRAVTNVGEILRN